MSKQDEELKFLGLGSVVDVDSIEKIPDTKYFVIARAVGKDSSGQTILRYRLCPHPMGLTPTTEEEVLTVEGKQITEVYLQGYSDEKDDAFLETFLAKMSNDIKEITKKQPQTNPPENSKEVVEEKNQESVTVQNEKLEKTKEHEKMKKDPFYKFRKKEVS